VCPLAAAVLEWDAPAEPSLAGFKIYIGSTSRDYERVLDVGLQTRVSLTNMDAGITYFLSATAYNTNGIESSFSEEVQYTPAVDGVNSIKLPYYFTISTNPALRFSAEAGQRWWIVSSTDLNIWKQVDSGEMETAAWVNFIDPSFPAAPQKFYRVIGTRP
jgi:hypothetical protein